LIVFINVQKIVSNVMLHFHVIFVKLIIHW